MLRALLRTTGAIQKAETVFASYLLWLYEVMTKYESYGSAMAHHVGSKGIMQSVAEHGYGSLTRFSRSGLGSISVHYGLLRHNAYFQHPSPWLKQLVGNARTGDKRATLVQLCYECTRVCADLKECEYLICSKGPSLLGDLDQASVTDAKTVDARFHTWELQRDMELPRLNVDIRAQERKVAWVRDLFCAAGAPRQMCISMRAEAFLEWKTYWIFRLILNYFILDLDDALETSGIDDATAPAVVRLRSMLTPVDVHAAEEVITSLTHAISAAIPSVLGVQSPSWATLKPHPTSTSETTSIPRNSEKASSPSHHDPDSIRSLSSIRGYHLYWLIFNLLRSFNRPRIRKMMGTADVQSWFERLLRFLLLEFGIAQAECYRRWFEDGLFTGWPTVY